ncbi:hypothetical protein ABKN59_005082 [Abortiporus biennis]
MMRKLRQQSSGNLSQIHQSLFVTQLFVTHHVSVSPPNYHRGTRKLSLGFRINFYVFSKLQMSITHLS